MGHTTTAITVTKANQSISFGTIPTHTYGDADFDPGATASSGLAVSYGASGNCTIVSGACASDRRRLLHRHRVPDGKHQLQCFFELAAADLQHQPGAAYDNG